jgi:hypothetical protein
VTRHFLLTLLVGSLAYAQESWPAGRLLLTGGAAWQRLELNDGQTKASIAGGSPGAHLHLSTAIYPLKWFGVALEGRGGLLKAERSATSAGPSVLRFRTGQLQLLAVPRWQVTSAVGLEAQLGIEVGARPSAFDASTREELVVTATPSFGPAAGLVASFDPGAAFSLQVFARASAGFGVGYLVQGGLQGRVGSVTLGPLGVGVAFSAEAHYFGSGSSQQSVQVGLGLAATWRTEVARAVSLTEVQSRELKGQVRRADDQPVPGATVTLDGASTTADGEGRFRFEGPSAGAHTLVAKAPGLKNIEQSVRVPESGPVEVVLRLAVPTGPGRLTGTVKTAAGATPSGLVLSVAGQTITVDAQGRFVAPAVGPGPVPVVAKAAGFNVVNEVAQVPAEGEASLELVLEPETVKAKAKFRGVVSSADGPVAKATVRVIERKLKVTVGAEGRFALEVPAGTYTLVIEAPKYITQTRKVDVAEGDQAIFQVELERQR